MNLNLNLNVNAIPGPHIAACAENRNIKPTMDSLASQSGSTADFMKSHPFARIRLGHRASLIRRRTERDIELCVAMSDDGNPAQLDSLSAETRHFHETVATDMLVGSLISTLLEAKYPGQTPKFLKPVHIGDRLTLMVTVTALDATSRRVRLRTACVDQHCNVVIDGKADLSMPADRLRSLRADPLTADKTLRSDELLGAVVNSQTGLRTERRISFVLDVPRYPKPRLITDAAINITPDFDAKVDTVQNAIDPAHGLGIKLPKVAILPAVETVTSRLGSSMDAAALSKMADSDQITAAWSMARSPSTMLCRWRRRRTKALSPRWLATPTSWWYPTWNRAIC